MPFWTILRDERGREFVKVHEPVGKMQIGGVDHFGTVAKRGRILVVRIKQKDMAVGVSIEDRP